MSAVMSAPGSTAYSKEIHVTLGICTDGTTSGTACPGYDGKVEDGEQSEMGGFRTFLYSCRNGAIFVPEERNGGLYVLPCSLRFPGL